ncbi:MAG TPA: phage terminase large subunit [Gemmatimonadaceae bacterium]|jgi:predicted phage terminase large subunit-like protein|nr:phage terminase large subunit [Gemmatimonadaceae bacterium]
MPTRSELRAAVRAFDHVEPLADFIARLTPKHAPVPSHLQRVVDVIEATRRGEVRATISMPPRFGKTITLAHGLAWRILYDPACLNFYATFGSDLSIQTSRIVRRLVRMAGAPLSSEAQAVTDWRTIFDGGLKATSVGGDVTGRGCNSGLIVADDLVKGRAEAESKLVRDRAWDWFRDDLMSRLEPGASLIVNMTRWHEDDIIGRLHRDPLGEKWIHVELPAVIGANGDPVDERTDANARALWPEVWGLDRLAPVRMRGEHGWWSLFQQRPFPKGGAMFKRAWFGVVEAAPAGGRAVRGWDLAATKDGDGAATAGVKIREVGGRFYVEHVAWLRGSPHEVEQLIVSTAQQDGSNVVQDLPQDPGQAGKSQRSYLAGKLAGFQVRFSPETGSKELRAEPLASQAQAGNVSLVRGAWNEEFLDEVEAFPVGRLKDRVDGASRAFAALSRGRVVQVPVAGGAIEEALRSKPKLSDDQQAAVTQALLDMI